MIRNIIFDWSGTLVDDLPAVLAATNALFEEHGLKPLTLDEFRAEFSLPFKNFYDRFIPNVPIAQLERSFHGHFIKAQTVVLELPHAREFLQFCRERSLRTFVLSTVHPDYYLAQAEASGFQQFIDRPYLQVWDKRAKIGELLKENNLAPTETLFIGDMQHDIETAKFGGVASCAVLTGYNGLEQLRQSEPDLIVEHLGELRDLLERNKLSLRPPADGVVPAPVEQPISTVGALIFNAKNQALMIHTQKWSDLWGIPGGKIKPGEPSLKALEREIMEETNLEIEDIQFVMVQDCIYSEEFYRYAHFVLLNYTCRARGPTRVKLNEEAREYKWVSLEAALKMPLNKPTRVLIEKVLANAAAEEGRN